MIDDISSNLQDSILSLSIYDNEVLRYVSIFINPEIFYSEYPRILCSELIQYYKEFKNSPNDHFIDIIDNCSKIKSFNKGKIRLFQAYIQRIVRLEPNKDYVLKKLNDYIRHQEISSSIIRGAELVKQSKYKEAEKVLFSAFRSGVHNIEFGIDYVNHKGSIEIPETICKTNIEIVDKYLDGIRRKELWVWLASTNVGKSWALIAMGKTALVQRKKVLHYTLEMDKDWVSLRYDMAISAMSTKENIYIRKSGEEIKAPLLLENKKIVLKKRKHLSALGSRLFIKNSPLGGLTLEKISNDLDVLEASMQFTPDIVIIDYADLMRGEHKYDERRHELSSIYKELGDLSRERNINIQTASQSNRLSMDAKVVTLKHFAEDIQKANHADVVLSLCQTQEEAAKGIMRIFCCKSRNDKKGWQCEMAQILNIGQFCIKSKEIDLSC